MVSKSSTIKSLYSALDPCYRPEKKVTAAHVSPSSQLKVIKIPYQCIVVETRALKANIVINSSLNKVTSALNPQGLSARNLSIVLRHQLTQQE
jgi:hypothetical protein